MNPSSIRVSKFPADPLFALAISANNAYMIYLNQSNIIIRSTKSLATYKIISNTEYPISGSTQMKLSPDNKMLAVFSPEQNCIRIIRLRDDDVSMIIQTNIEEIVQFEWLNISFKYGNDYIMAVYSSCGLSLKLYSIAGSVASCIHTIYKYASEIAEHPSLDQYTIALKSGIKNRLFTFAITDNKVQQVSDFEVKDNTSDIKFKYSPLNSWMLVYDALSGDLNLGIYNFLGLGKLRLRKDIEVGYAFQTLNSVLPSIAITTMNWAVNNKNEEFIICGDHLENIYMISMKGPLKIQRISSHSSSQNNEYGDTTVFERNLKLLNYNRKTSSLFRLPSDEKLSLCYKGIDKIEISSKYSKFITVTKSMPAVLFLWDFEKISPILIINTQANIVSATLGSEKIVRSNNKYINSIIDSIIVINNGINITVYSPVMRDVPLILDVNFESKIVDFSLLDILTDNGEVLIKIACWCKNEIKVITQSLSTTEPMSPSESVENTSVILNRQGSSPMAKEETDTNVRSLINGVQQSEWARRPSLLENGDTFMSKKRKLATGKENVNLSSMNNR